MSTSSGSTSHGYVDLEWQDDVLKVYVNGPFNLQGVQCAFEKIKHATYQYEPATWYRLDILSDNPYGSPEVMKTIANSYRWCLENNCVAVGSVCSSPMQINMIAKLQEKTGLAVKGFESESQVQSWFSEMTPGIRRTRI